MCFQATPGLFQVDLSSNIDYQVIIPEPATGLRRLPLQKRLQIPTSVCVAGNEALNIRSG
jgi:hypothetical protein